MNSSLINIGDELLIGQVVNTNAAKMSQMLGAAGIEVTQVLTIGDDADAIHNTLRKCLETNDIVIITGGLGPTKDDITKQVLCDHFDSELYEDEAALENVRRRMEAFGRELTDINRQQAWVPRCCWPMAWSFRAATRRTPRSLPDCVPSAAPSLPPGRNILPKRR